MAELRPFRAYRPERANVSRVASVPYDVISTEEARSLARGNPQSFLHVSRPEIDLEPGVDEHEPRVYAQAEMNLRRFIDEKVLCSDSEPRLYVYAQRMGTHRQVGVVGCASVAEYLSDTIRKHEKTRADKEDDRTRHIEALGAHDEPVFLTYRADGRIDALVAEATAAEPEYHFSTVDDVEHTFWVLSAKQTQELAAAFRNVPTLYVADGHHRSAAAARVAAARSGQAGEHDAFLAVVFPHDQMQILSYNRVVRDPENRSTEALLAELGKAVTFSEVADGVAATPRAPKELGIFIAGRWYKARFADVRIDENDPVSTLDCSLCQEKILSPIFHVDDPRRDKNVDFVGGIRGISELEARVNSGAFTMAIHLYPTQIGQLFQVSDKGMLMPPKSTWFEPKLRSGLFVHRF